MRIVVEAGDDVAARFANALGALGKDPANLAIERFEKLEGKNQEVTE